jgi:transcriptional regulator with XRE-family HTH domain
MAGSSRSGRRRLVPSQGFGQAVYDRMRQMRNKNGTTWEVSDLAREVGVSGTTVRGWVKGAIPKGRLLGRLAEKLAVDAQALLKGEIYPLNLPQESLSPQVRENGQGQQYKAQGRDRAVSSDSAGAEVRHPTWQQVIRIFEAELEAAEAWGRPLSLEKGWELLRMVRVALERAATSADAVADAEAVAELGHPDDGSRPQPEALPEYRAGSEN